MREDRDRLSTRDIADAARRRDAERQAAAREATVQDPRVQDGRVDVHDDRVHDAPPQRVRDVHAAEAQERELALFPHDELEGFRTRWEAIQTGFVDEPKAAVEQADALVAQVVTRLADVFSKERETMERQWGTGTDVSTEDLRQALKRYRSFFNRL